MIKLFICVSAFFSIIFASLHICNAKKLDDQGRLFRNTYTVTTSTVVTSLVPSSCLQVEPTLPPCRRLRFLRFPKLPTITFKDPASTEVIGKWKTEPKIESTPLGWGEYLGLYAPTVTVTATDIHIATVQDPSLVITFLVKGCRPLKLPLGFDRCPQEHPSSVAVEDALLTATVASPAVSVATLLPTKTLSPISTTAVAFNGLQDNSNGLEPSPQEIIENEPPRRTTTLA